MLEALDLSNVTCVSHSMGGGEVVRYLARYGPMRVDRVVFIGTTLPFMMKTADNPDGVDPAVFERARRDGAAQGFSESTA